MSKIIHSDLNAQNELHELQKPNPVSKEPTTSYDQLFKNNLQPQKFKDNFFDELLKNNGFQISPALDKQFQDTRNILFASASKTGYAIKLASEAKKLYDELLMTQKSRNVSAAEHQNTKSALLNLEQTKQAVYEAKIAFGKKMSKFLDEIKEIHEKQPAPQIQNIQNRIRLTTEGVLDPEETYMQTYKDDKSHLIKAAMEAKTKKIKRPSEEETKKIPKTNENTSSRLAFFEASKPLQIKLSKDQKNNADYIVITAAPSDIENFTKKLDLKIEPIKLSNGDFVYAKKDTPRLYAMIKKRESEVKEAIRSYKMKKVKLPHTEERIIIMRGNINALSALSDKLFPGVELHKLPELSDGYYVIKEEAPQIYDMLSDIAKVEKKK